MRIPWRRDTVPADVKQALVLKPGERVLSVCHSEDTAYLVATDRALHLVDPPEQVRWRWDEIDRATWQPPLLELQLQVEGGFSQRVVPVDAQGELPAVVRDRVTNSIIVNSRVVVPGGQVRVVARRNSDTGILEWRIVPGPGVDPTDPAVRALTDLELTRLRGQLGV